MKKFLMATATLAMLSTAVLADQNTENMNKMDELRKMKYSMMMEMNEAMMETLKKQEAMLSNYQKILKTMMENETNN